MRHETRPAPEPVKQPEPAPEKTEAEKKEERDSFLKDIMDTPAPQEELEATRRVPDLPREEVKQERIWTEEDEETTPRPKFKFDDLQFGENYNKEGK